LSITYDNFLMSAERPDMARRLAGLQARLRLAGVVIGDVSGPAKEVESCGYRFSVKEVRKWSLKPSWCTKALPLLTNLATSLDGRRVQAGLALWAIRALLYPVGQIHHLIRILDDEPYSLEAAAEELREVHALVKRNPWRTLKSLTCGSIADLRRDAVVVFSDASVHGAGAVEVGRGSKSWPWKWTRAPEEQQQCEAEAALLAVRWSTPAPTTLLVVDNEGVAAWLVSGNPRTPAALEVLLRLKAELQRRRSILWVTVVTSSEMLADGPSRLSAEDVYVHQSPEGLLWRAQEVDWSAAMDV
jgi:hypothetical protein